MVHLMKGSSKHLMKGQESPGATLGTVEEEEGAGPDQRLVFSLFLKSWDKPDISGRTARVVRMAPLARKKGLHLPMLPDKSLPPRFLPTLMPLIPPKMLPPVFPLARLLKARVTPLAGTGQRRREVPQRMVSQAPPKSWWLTSPMSLLRKRYAF